jgi:alpha-tubulin suppressor-like RCC1 family protein
VKRSLAVIIAIAAIGVLLASSGTALAARCPAGSPYASSAKTLEACGMRISPLRGINPLPGGGREYMYEEPSGASFSMTVPPASFDARSASASELATYGIPPEPPASSPEHTIWKEMISQGIKFATPPPFIAEAPPSSSSPDVPGAPAAEKGALEPLVSPPSGSVQAQTKIWSGYFDWNGKGTYTHSTGYYIEPKTTSSCEKPIVAEPSASYIWAGIGGWGGNPDLGQDGTAQHEEGLGEDEAWYEILPAQKHPKGLGLKAIGGKYVEADTHYENGEYKFYVHNLVSEGESAYGHGSGPIDANVNDFIIERPGKDNLLDFGNVTFQGFTNNKAFGEKFGANKTERLEMENSRGEKNAAPSQNISSKYEFHDEYKDCNGLGEEEGEGGAPAEGPLPVTTTESASPVSESGATLHASINPEGFDTRYHFEYGTEAENYGASTPSVDAGAGTTTVHVSSAITGLQPGTTYHYRIIADSATGTSAGADTTFTTSGSPPPPPPTVTTEGASGLGAHKATVEGKVNPNGLDTHYYFEYGPNKSLFEKDAPALPGSDAGSGSVPVHVGIGVTELAPYTTYYYRLVASNSTGTSYGAEKEFTTAATGTFSAGAYHTCALVSAGGSIDCWGENYYGQLGNGTNKNNSTKPVAVSGITTAIEVGAGGEHTCALLTGGKIDCWGYNKFGELGNGTTKESTTPVEVSGVSTAVQVSAGYAHTCALLSSGKIDCWGENAYEQLGDGKTANSSTPVEVSGISTATSVTAGGFGTCATLSGGTVDCWGYGEFGELGNGKTENSSTPVKVSNISNAVAVTAVGYFQACAQLSSGTIDCWGDNEDGELGNGTTTNSSTPVAVSGITTGAGVAAGAFHTCGLLSAKSLDCWGENYFGELGNGTTTNSSTPVAVSGITTAAGIIAGTYHTCGRLVGGSVKCWGENAFGQLGNGTTTNSTTPVEVSGLP